MEEVQVIDCPPTPEILLPSATPPSTSTLLDMLDSSSSAEELDNCSIGGDAGEDESGRNSPPPKCAICLGKCRQKCYTDSCRHQFCYRCLLEWSKIKAECPLCKQAFRSIIYTRNTFGNYQEHKISIAPPASPPSYSGQGSGSAGGGAARTVPQVYHRLDFTLSQPPRFTYSATLHVQPSQSERLRQLFLHQSGDVQRFSREFPDDSIPSRQNGPEWRRYIYHRRLHARPLADINGRMRECSASFYRENPAQIHRLMPWINRELVALCRNNPAQVSLIMEDFPNLLMTYDITSPAFRERVSYWGRVRTAHFIHELLNFARSPYDLIGYDRSVQYDPYYNNNVVVLSSSSSSSSGSGLSGSEGEDDVVPILEPIPGTSGTMNSVGGPSGSARRGRTQFTIETRSSDQTVIMTGSFGGAGVSGIVSVSTSGSQHNNVPGTSTSGYPDMSRMQPLTSMVPQTQPPPPVNRLEDGENISLSSSDSDDCRIVGALKPPHLRTPEMVSLESESDSDVVFVNEDAHNVRNQAMESNSVLEQLFPETLLNEELAKLEEDHAFASEYNNGASTSSGGGSASGGGMKKYYARPRLNRHSDGIGFKSIYEASESEKSHGEPSIKSDSDSSSHDEVKFNIRGPAPVSRKRKAVKRRQASSNGSSSSNSSEDSSTSDSESSSPSSSGCSSSSTSNSDSDTDVSSDNNQKVTLKKRSRRSNVRSSRKSSVKRRQKESKPKRSKAKKRKTSSSKKRSSSSKRQKLQIPKQPSKSSPESGKGTSASCTSGPSTETLPNMVQNPAASSSANRKRKLKSAIIKLNPVARHHQLAISKRRRKTPVCSSELISSTDFSSEENKPEVIEQPQPPVQQRESSDSSSGDTDSSDSEEGLCTIASLIRAAKADNPATTEMKNQQNTSSSSSCSSSSVNSFRTEPSVQLGGGPAENEEEEEEEDDDDDDEEEDDGHNQSSSSRAGEEVAQVIAVGAEVEL